MVNISSMCTHTHTQHQSLVFRWRFSHVSRASRSVYQYDSATRLQLQTFLEDRIHQNFPVRQFSLGLWETLTCSLLDADSRTLQVRGLNEDGGVVESIGGKSVEAVLRQTGGDGDLMLPFTGGCRRRKTRRTNSHKHLDYSFTHSTNEKLYFQNIYTHSEHPL